MLFEEKKSIANIYTGQFICISEIVPILRNELNNRDVY